MGMQIPGSSSFSLPVLFVFGFFLNRSFLDVGSRSVWVVLQLITLGCRKLCQRHWMPPQEISVCSPCIWRV